MSRTTCCFGIHLILLKMFQLNSTWLNLECAWKSPNCAWNPFGSIKNVHSSCAWESFWIYSESAMVSTWTYPYCAWEFIWIYPEMRKCWRIHLKYLYQYLDWAWSVHNLLKYPNYEVIKTFWSHCLHLGPMLCVS